MPAEVVWRVRLEIEGHEPGLPVWLENEDDARKAEAAGYAVARFERLSPERRRWTLAGYSQRVEVDYGPPIREGERVEVEEVPT